MVIDNETYKEIFKVIDRWYIIFINKTFCWFLKSDIEFCNNLFVLDFKYLCTNIYFLTNKLYIFSNYLFS